MLTLVEVRTAQGALLSLPLDDISSGLVVEDVSGLDPVKATIVSSSFALMDGEEYHSSRRGSRNIIIKLGLEPDYVTSTVRSLRQRVYDFFMPKSEVDLRFYDSDGLIVDITGRVETCETDLFTSEPTMNISIICFNPDLIGDTVTYSGNSVADTGNITPSTVINYDGSVEIGITLVLHVNRSLPSFTFYVQPADGTLRTMNFTAPLVSGDTLTIVSIPGSKAATLTRSSVNSSILYGVAPQSDWMTFQKGDNLVRVYATGAAIPYDIIYTKHYGGM